MPRFAVKPLVTLTRAQTKAFAERAMTKSGGIAESARKELSTFKLPESKTVVQGVLRHKSPHLGMSKEVPYPIEKARKMYRENPEAFSPGRTSHTARGIRLSEPGETEAIIGPEIPRFGRRLVSEEIKTVPVDTPKAYREHLVTTPIAEIQTNDAHAERLWHIITKGAGGRSIGGKMWETYRRGCKQKSKYANAHDYFKSCFIRWKEDPKSLARNKQDREARLLNEIWNAYGKDLPEGMVK
jgi:hypothetical protein